METYTYQYEENLFLRALVTNEDQEGNVAIGGYPIGIADERAMADYVNEVTSEPSSVITDDAQSLGVMLVSGHPEVFFDRIALGDAPWEATLNDPWGNVEYLLVSTDERCRLPCEDLGRVRYPGVLADRVPGMEVVFRTGRYVLMRVDERPPRAEAES